MSTDQRIDASRFYDLQQFQNDVPFYEERIPSPEADLLDLGCGTGRVLVPLAALCSYIHGVELSSAMIARCHARMVEAGLDPARAVAEQGNMTAIDLGRTFDLIIAPFRVFQALETDELVEGCLASIRKHLAPNGSAILSMFNPMYSPEKMRADWVTLAEKVDWEVEKDGERIVASDRRPRLDPEKLVLYPELIYRRYQGEELIEEVVMPIVMRCWYPDQIIEVLESHGFQIINKWGGYDGEEWGQGNELVVQFGID